MTTPVPLLFQAVSLTVSVCVCVRVCLIAFLFVCLFVWVRVVRLVYRETTTKPSILRVSPFWHMPKFVFIIALLACARTAHAWRALGALLVSPENGPEVTESLGVAWLCPLGTLSQVKAVSWFHASLDQ